MKNSAVETSELLTPDGVGSSNASSRGPTRPIRPNRISRPDAGNIPNLQDIQKNKERTESTALIQKEKEELLTKGSILEQVYHESNMDEAKQPLLLVKQSTSVLSKINEEPSETKPDRLTEAVNKDG